MRKVKLTLVAGIVAGMVGGASVVAVAQDDAAPAASWVTGTVTYAPSCSTPSGELVGEVRQDRGYRCNPQRWSSDDPRLEGETTVVWNADVYTLDEGSISVTTMAWDIRGETGGWSCNYPVGLERGSGLYTTNIQGTDRILCTGSGANDGLTAVLIADWGAAPKSFEGLVFAGEVPPMPEL
mgnify:CR=1 FL=1